MPYTSTKFNKEARESVYKGVREVSEAVATTLSPMGRNVLIEKDYQQGRYSVIHDGVNVSLTIHPKEQFARAGARIMQEATQRQRDAVGDGPQPLYAKILTPNGFVRMGDVKVGDEICGTNGTIQKVEGVFEKGVKQVYIVRFGDGREVECSSDHLWRVTTNQGAKKVITTQQMLQKGLFTAHGRGKSYRYFAPLTSVEFISKELPLDPYLVGLLLGDGSLSGTGSIELSLGIKKKPIIENIVLPEGLTLHMQFVENKSYYRVKIQGKTLEGKTIEDYIKDIGLYGVRSGEKFIPKDYLYASVKDRESLLQGLSDIDGYINTRGLLEYSTVSQRLFFDMLELLRSLGKTTHHYLRERKVGEGSYSAKPIYRISELQGYKYGNRIEEITPTETYTPMRCIKVSNDDSLYITDDYVVTHNTTAVCILTQAILDEALRDINQGTNPMTLRRGLEAGGKKVIASLKRQATPITTLRQKEQIASISAQDEELGKLIAQVIHKVGDNGVITVDESKASETTVEYQAGMQIDRGYMHPYFVTDHERQTAVLEDAYVLVTDYNLMDLSNIGQFLDSVIFPNTKKLLIIAPDMGGDFLMAMVGAKISGKFLPLCVRAPGVGMLQTNFMQDICALTGARFISREAGHKFADMTFNDLGKVHRVIASKLSTIIEGGAGHRDDVLARIATIKGQMLDTTLSAFDRDQLKNRLARLTDGVAVIKVAGQTEVEMKERKERAIDAVCATQAAIRSGIVPGGEIVYLSALSTLDEEDRGEAILKRALIQPYSRLITNAGCYLKQTMDQYPLWKRLLIKLTEEENIISLEDRRGHDIGFNVVTREYEDMIRAGIIDPADVSMTAVKTAISVSTQLMSLGAAVTIDNEGK